MTSALWRHADFRRLWLARTVSLVGSQISMLAIPLTAAITLDASALQVSLLAAANFLPWLMIGLHAGVVVDRGSRRSIMVWTDLARAALLITVPIAAFAGALSLAQLFLVTLGIGLLTVFFDTASGAFLPSLLQRDQLTDGNAKLASSTEVTRAAGPALAGVLVQVLTAPFALLADSASFLVSAAFLRGISRVEPARPAEARRPIVADLREGVRYLAHQPVLRILVLEAATFNFGAVMSGAIAALYALRVLHLSPGQIGLAVSFLGIGGLAGAAVAPLLGRRIGFGPTMAVTAIGAGAGALLIPLDRGTPALATVILAGAYLIWGVSFAANGVVAHSLRQAIVPPRLLGRVIATSGVVQSGLNPLAAVLGGLLATWIGLRGALFVAAAFLCGSIPWLLTPTILRIRTLPEEVHEVPGPERVTSM